METVEQKGENKDEDNEKKEEEEPQKETLILHASLDAHVRKVETEERRRESRGMEDNGKGQMADEETNSWLFCGSFCPL
jgi:hypothetical protein